MHKDKPNSKFFMKLFFLIPVVFMLLYFIILLPIGQILNYLFHNQEVGMIFGYSAWLIGIIAFLVFVIIYSIKNHKEMNVFLKVFFAVGLLLATYHNFTYALAKQSGDLFNDPSGLTHMLTNLYIGSLTSPPYNLPYYFYERWYVFPLVYFDILAFITGVPYFIILTILPSFLAIPFFYLWTGFSVFYVVVPYETLTYIGRKIKGLLQKIEK
jgi:hypothetical protein